MVRKNSTLVEEILGHKARARAILDKSSKFPKILTPGAPQI